MRKLSAFVVAFLAIARLAAAQSAALAPPSQTTITSSAGPITITAIEHASTQIEYGGKVIQVDPAEGDLKASKPADLLLVTDVHDDHMNVSRLQKLRKPGAPVVVPAAVRDEAGDSLAAPLEVLANGQTKTIAGFPVEAVAAYNIEHKMGDEPFHTKGRGNGYVITIGGKRIFLSGDTECVPEIKALRNIDVALLPMNLPFTMSPADAAACVKTFRPAVFIPYHYRGSNPDEVKPALAGSGIDVRMLNWYPEFEHEDVVAIPRPGRLVDVGGRQLHLYCTGSGSTTVLLDAGMLGFALDWWLAQPLIAATHRVCSFDQPAHGWSDPHPHPDAVKSVTVDLHAALAAAGERAPYIFVGAMTGAIDGRVFHQIFPNEVVGFVFINGDHEDMAIAMVDGKPTPLWSLSADQLKSALASMRPSPPAPGAPPPPPPPPPPRPPTDAPYDKLPADVLTTRSAFFRSMFRGMFARTDEDASMESDRATFAALHALGGGSAPPLGGMPVVVIKGAMGAPPPAFASDDKLAALSSNATKRVIARSGPEVQLYDPAAVAQAVSDVSEAVARRAPLRVR